MMNYIWGGMLITGIIFGAATGNMQAVTDAVLQSSKEAVTLGISMLGIVAFWTGLMEVAEEAGVITGLTRLIAPFMRFLFPKIPKGHRAWDSLSANFVANILGLGWAATPAGLRAMNDLQELERERGNSEFMDTKIAMADSGALSNCGARTASNEMCTFLVMNISSLQLIPVNIIAYRSQYGSANPAAVIAPAIVATFFSTVVAVIYCKVMNRKQRV
ncbi:MAG: nucleoside recognition protein [Lachnospiraceae bacterium]|nr:nucleoside recognition protein [Lachnospiraceae bacterium]